MLSIGNVKARMVRQVENIEAVFQLEPFRNVRHLHDGEVAALLPGLAENVALSAVGMKLVSNVSPGGIAEHGNDPSTCWALATLHGRAAAR